MLSFSGRAAIAASILGLAAIGAEGEGISPKVHKLFRASGSSRAAVADCPSTPGDWRAWRVGAVDTLLKPRLVLERTPGPFLDPDQVAAQSVAIANFFDDCKASFPSDSEALFGNLKSFTLVQRNDLDVYHQFGHGPDIDDAQYLARIKGQVDLPCLLKSQQFLRAISTRSTYRAALDMIERRKKKLPVAGCRFDGKLWTTLIYKSRFLGTPDDSDTFGRFLVVVPGDDYDKWIQFGIWTPDDAITATPINNVSIVSVPARQRPEGDRFTALIDWRRIYDDPSKIRLVTRKEATGVTGNCQQCHKSGLIGIHPEWVYQFEGLGNNLLRAIDQKTDADALNGRIAGYRGAANQSTGDGDDFARAMVYGGLGLGPNSRAYAAERSDDFMKACIAKANLNPGPDLITKIKTNMNCTNCHDDGSSKKGLINFPMATQRTTAPTLSVADGTWPNLVYTYIMNGWMPRRGAREPALNEGAEREALFQCLTLEYFDPVARSGLFVDWLNNAAPSPQQAQKRQASFALYAKEQASREDARRSGRVTMYAAVAGDAGGAQDFAAQCADCHSARPGVNDIGPSLFGVVGRQAGSAAGYAYSVDLRAAQQKNIRWSEDDLMLFLIDQSAFLTDKLGRPAASDMSERFPDEALRHRIVEYLMTLK